MIRTDGDAYGYVWNETDARCGACEIASCVFSYLKTLFKENIKSVITDFDNCSVQNRNRPVTAIVWLSLKILTHRLRISEILPWDRKSYLTLASLPRLSCEGFMHRLYWNSRTWSSSDVIVMLK